MRGFQLLVNFLDVLGGRQILRRLPLISTIVRRTFRPTSSAVRSNAGWPRMRSARIFSSVCVTRNKFAAVLAALQSVDGVCMFAEKTATRFLTLVQPDIYVKGGDYTLETLNQEERGVVERAGGKVVVVPIVPGKSTTAILQQIARQ
jgi:hypothetical protein